MDLRSKSQWNLLGGRPRAKLLSRFLTCHSFELAAPPLPGKLLLEGEGAPRSPRLNLLGAPAQPQQIRHEGHGHRALSPCRVLGDLVLAQPDDAFQFLDPEFDRPSSQIECHSPGSGGLRQMGHEQFRVLGAVVTPPATQYDRDISHLPQLGPLGNRPQDPAPSVGHDQGPADLAVIMERQRGNQSAQGVAGGQLPGAREGEDKEPLAGLNGLEMRPRGIGRIGHDDNPRDPGGQHDFLQQLPKEGVLRLIALAAFWFDQPKGQGHAVHGPLRDQDDHLQAKGIGGILGEAPLLGHGRRRRPFAFEGASYHQLETPILRGRNRRQGLTD